MMTKEERGPLIRSLSAVVLEVESRIRKWVTDELKALTDLVAQTPGPKGEKGDRGDRGEKGDMGEVLDMSPQMAEFRAKFLEVFEWKATHEGFLLHLQQELAGVPKEAIQGRDGKDGIAGKDGRDGIDGKNGTDGIGIAGKDGAPGTDGIDGRDGREGKDGRDGKDGERGKDALELEILPAIDMAKSYPRGTFAKHSGGLIRAIRNTEPSDDLETSGWDVIVEGIAKVDVTQDGARSFVFDVTFTSGKGWIETFHMPVMIYRGTYSVSEKYLQGSTVTHQGSLWHCNVDNPDGSPGHSESWTLVAKRGQDGKLVVKEVEAASKVLSLK